MPPHTHVLPREFMLHFFQQQAKSTQSASFSDTKMRTMRNTTCLHPAHCMPLCGRAPRTTTPPPRSTATPRSNRRPAPSVLGAIEDKDLSRSRICRQICRISFPCRPTCRLRTQIQVLPGSRWNSDAAAMGAACGSKCVRGARWPTAAIPIEIPAAAVS